MEQQPYGNRCEIDIDLPSPRHASDLARILSVDRQLGSGGRVTQTFTAMDGRLHVTISAETTKLLRVVVSSFYDHLQVALKCYQEFDDTLLP
jgi:tRNA threonylcarbamoyladenosine modification (KEOPS) complex  Pcc1 subunit